MAFKHLSPRLPHTFPIRDASSTEFCPCTWAKCKPRSDLADDSAALASRDALRAVFATRPVSSADLRRFLGGMAWMAAGAGTNFESRSRRGSLAQCANTVDVRKRESSNVQTDDWHVQRQHRASTYIFERVCVYPRERLIECELYSGLSRGMKCNPKEPAGRRHLLCTILNAPPPVDGERPSVIAQVRQRQK